MTYIGPPDEILEHGKEYTVKTQSMTGKIFEGQNFKPENRIMVWCSDNYKDTLWYKVFESKEEIEKYFKD